MATNHLKSYLTLAALVIVTSLSFFVIIAGRDSYQQTFLVADQDAKNINLLISKQVEDTFKKVDLILQEVDTQITYADSTDLGSHSKVSDLMRTHLNDASYIRAFFVIGADGYIIHDTDHTTPHVSLADRQYFLVHKPTSTRKMYIGQPLVSRSVGTWFVSLSQELTTADGSFAGVLVAVLDLNSIENYFAQLKQGDNGIVSLKNADGMLFASWPKFEEKIREIIPKGEIIESKTVAESEILYALSPFDQRQKIINSHKLKNYPFIVSVETDQEEIHSLWVERSRPAGILFVLLIVAIISFACFFWKYLANLKTYENNLRQSEMRLTQAEQIAQIGNWSYNIANESIVWSPLLWAIFGRTPLEQPPNYAQFSAWIHPDYREHHDRFMKKMLAVHPGEKITDIFYSLVRPDGEERCIEMACEGEFDATGKLQYLFGTVQDITERKKAEKGLRESEERFKKMFHSNSAVMLLLDPESGSIIDANLAAESFYGYSYDELISSNINQINTLNPELITQEMQKSLEEKRNYFIFPHRISNGDIRTVEVHSTPIPLLNKTILFSIIHDISDRVKAENERLEFETQLRQKHKMEAVGYMAGGIAHNFNNNLSMILGNVELSQMKQPRGSEVIHFLENAKIAIHNSRDLILKIITYSRKGMQSTIVTQLTPIIKETISLLQSTLPTTVRLQQNINPACSSVLVNADPLQVQEILVNLCNNAVKAMDEKGDLTISLEPVELSQTEIPAQYDGIPGRYSKLSVQDTGCGMPNEMLDKIFDPFYTTKEDYEGAGMGLATVQGIVAQYGGIIKVNSIPNQGTVFNLYFPIVDNAATEPKPINTDTPKGTKKILFVDDDEQLANIGKQLLTEMGYQVAIMTESPEALKLFTGNPDHFDMVITDQTMPDLTGEELIQELKKIRPDLRTILCTGYSSKINEEEAQQQGIDAFCVKPLDVPELLQTVRRVLDEGEIT
ncbi:MAG: PAS domain S-box protein [Desulfuromusa sp.]|nr:PAS domain S-box protein [Desulfuromusa sp.]